MQSIELTSGVPEWNVRILTDSPQIATLIHRVYGSLIAANSQTDNLPAFVIAIGEQKDGYLVKVKEKQTQCPTPQDVLYIVYRLIDSYTETNKPPNSSVFHGGIVGTQGKTVAILAPSRTGKSTLITYLGLQGYLYFADDYIFINRQTYQIESLQLPIMLRSLDVLLPEVQRHVLAEGFNRYRNEYNYIIGDLPCENSGQARPLDTIFFIDRCEKNAVCECTKGVFYKALLFNLKNVMYMEEEQAFCFQLAERLKGCTLQYKDLPYVNEVLKQV